MKPKIINIDISEITEKLKLIDNKISEEFILKLKESLISLPDFDTYNFDVCIIPIVEPPEVLIDKSIYPSLDAMFTKTITFRKNYKNKSWEFYSKNF